MPFPLLLAIPAVAGGVATVGRPFLHRWLKQNHEKIEAWALKNAFDAIGLPDLTDEKLSRENFTKAINKKFLPSGALELSNIFDRAAVERDVSKYAFKKAAADLGISLEAETVDGMRDALGEWVRGQVREQVDAGGGELINGAKDVAQLVDQIQDLGYGPDGEPVPGAGLLMTKEAISNRERQARYRASHTKKWESR